VHVKARPRAELRITAGAQCLKHELPSPFERCVRKLARQLSEDGRYSLATVEDWWTIVLRSGFRAFVELVPEGDREASTRQHLERLTASWRTAGGFGLELPVHFVIGSPARASVTKPLDR